MVDENMESIETIRKRLGNGSLDSVVEYIDVAGAKL